MPTLFSWSTRAHGPDFLAHGIVSGHPKLGMDANGMAPVSTEEILAFWEGEYKDAGQLN